MKICKKCKKEKDLSEFYSQEKVNSKGECYTYYRPDCKECTFQSSMDWRENNREAYLESCRRRNNKPKAKVRIKKANDERRERGEYREWQQNNKEKVRGYNYYRQQHKLHKISIEEWEACKLYFDNSCAYCGMTLDEHSEEYNQDLHKEHIDHEGSNGIENCIPACKPCNSSKWKHDLDEWFNEKNPIYEVNRHNKITKWINEDYKNYIETNNE